MYVFRFYNDITWIVAAKLDNKFICFPENICLYKMRVYYLPLSKITINAASIYVTSNKAYHLSIRDQGTVLLKDLHKM